MFFFFFIFTGTTSSHVVAHHTPTFYHYLVKILYGFYGFIILIHISVNNNGGRERFSMLFERKVDDQLFARRCVRFQYRDSGHKYGNFPGKRIFTSYESTGTKKKRKHTQSTTNSIRQIYE